MNIGTLWAQIGLDNSKLVSGARHSTKVVNDLSNDIGGKLTSASNLAAGALGMLGVAFTADYLIGQVKAGIAIIDDLKISVISMSAQIATMQGPANVAKNYEAAKVYAEGLVEALKRVDAQSFANSKGLLAMSEAMINQGVILDYNKKKEMETFTAVSNLIAMKTKGQNQEMQIRQEMNALLSGEARMGAVVAKQIDTQAKASGDYKNGLKDIVKLGKEHGDFWQRLAPYMTGVQVAAKDIQGTWEAVTSSWETAMGTIKKEVFADVYKRAVEEGGKFVEWVKANSSQIASVFRESASVLADATKFAVAYFAVFVAAPAVITAVTVAIQRLQVQMALASMEMAGATTVAKGYALVMGTDVVLATWKAADMIGKLAIAGKVAAAAFVGWEIGKWIEKHCATARQAMVSVIALMDVLITSAKVGWQTYAKVMKAGMSLDFNGAINESKKGYDTYKKEIGKIKQIASETWSYAGNRTPINRAVTAITIPKLPLGGGSVDDKGRSAAASKAEAEAKRIAELNERIAEMTTKVHADKLQLLDIEAAKYLKQGADRVTVEKWVATEKDKINTDIMSKAWKILDKNQADNVKFYEEQIEKAHDLATVQINNKMILLDTAEAFREISRAEAAQERLTLNEQLLAQQKNWLELTGKGADAVLNQMRKVKEAAATLLQSSDNFMAGAMAGLMEYAKGIPSGFESARDAVTGMMKSMEDAVVSFAMTGKLNFKDMADSIISDLIRIEARKLISGIGSWIGDGVSSLFTANAMGGVYAGPGISAYSGKIVSSPTIFPFAKGVGLMGEKGREGILPLEMTSGGLGVNAVVGREDRGAPNVTVNVVNQSGEKVGAEVQDMKFDWENMTFTLLLKKLKSSPDARGSLAAAMGG